MSNFRKKRTPGEWGQILFCSFVVICFALAILGKLGFIDEPPPISSDNRELAKFDNKECLSRNAYRLRSIDPMISDEMLHGDVARACVLERREFEGW